jgi:hypothetical protein
MNPHHIERWDLDPDPHQSESWIRIRISLQKTSQNVGMEYEPIAYLSIFQGFEPLF